MNSCNKMMYSNFISFTFILMVNLCNINGRNIFHNPCGSNKLQSDIALRSNEKTTGRSKRALTNIQSRIWPLGIIPYEISSAFNGREKLLIHKAIQHWQENTCLVFKRKTTETEYVFFQKESGCGCCSFVGRMGEGKAQGINLDKKCINYGTILHEIGHAVGFWHEHARPDRDLFLKIITKHIRKDELRNFDKKSLKEIDSLGIPYDYGSLMHYGKNTFSKQESKNAILPILDPQIEIGQRRKLSVFDAKQTNLLYACPTDQRTFIDPYGVIDYEIDSIHENPTNARIIAPEGHQILLYFEQLNFSSTCDSCQITLSDGNAVRHVYCRDKKPPNVFLSSSNHVFIKLSRKQNEVNTCSYVAKYNVLCGGNIEADIGHIQSPKYPDYYDSNRICEWNIKVKEGHNIQFNFDILKLERTPNCDRDYIEVIDIGSNKHLGRFCRFRDVRNLRTSSHLAKIRFRSNDQNSKQGFSLTFSKVLKVSYLVSKIYIGEYQIRTAISIQRGLVSDPCSKNNGGCSHICTSEKQSVKCSCYEGYRLENDQKHCTPACNNTVNVIPGQHGKIVIPFRTYGKIPIVCQWVIHGFPGHSLIFEVSKKQMLKNDENVMEIYGIDVSNSNKMNLIKVTHQTEKINLPYRTIIVKIFLKKSETRNIQLASYFLEKNACLIQNGGCQHICNSNKPKFLCSCKFGYMLETDGKSCSPGNCIMKINKPQGLITNPNFPEYYETTKQCQWEMSTLPGHHIVFQIKDVQMTTKPMEKTPFRCPLYMQDGNSATKNIMMCKQGDMFRTKTHKTNVYFRQTFEQKLRFKISYSSECGGELIANKKHQDIYSHLSFFNNTHYPNKMLCKWRITHHNKKFKILLHFKKFNLENEPCRFDYVSVYDGPTDKYPLISRLCGSKLKENIFISSSNNVVVTFVTDQSVSGLGFHLTYKRTRAQSTLTLLRKMKKHEKHKFGRRRDFFVFDANKISSS